MYYYFTSGRNNKRKKIQVELNEFERLGKRRVQPPDVQRGLTGLNACARRGLTLRPIHPHPPTPQRLAQLYAFKCTWSCIFSAAVSRLSSRRREQKSIGRSSLFLLFNIDFSFTKNPKRQKVKMKIFFIILIQIAKCTIPLVMANSK